MLRQVNAAGVAELPGGVLTLFDLAYQFAQRDFIGNLDTLINFDLLERRAHHAQRLQSRFFFVDHRRLDGGIDVIADAHCA